MSVWFCWDGKWLLMMIRLCTRLLALLVLLVMVSIGLSLDAHAEAARKSGPPAEKHLLPNQAHTGPEAKVVLAAGAKRLDLPDFNTYAVYWFPENYNQQTQHRVLFALHGSSGNAYQAVYHQLQSAKQNGYGIIALQWWMGGKDAYMQPRMVEAALLKSFRLLSSQYLMNPGQIALETFSRSGANSYEIAYWNKQLQHPLYQLIIVQSGGIPQNNPKPLVRDLLAGKLGDSPLAGTRFFFYCGRKDKEWGEEMCKQIHYASEVVTKLGGQVVRLIDDPNGGHGGLHNTPAYRQAEISTFLNLTQ